MQADRIACASYNTEEDAEKVNCLLIAYIVSHTSGYLFQSLYKKMIPLGGMLCDVTTFKAGNRKV